MLQAKRKADLNRMFAELEAELANEEDMILEAEVRYAAVSR